MLTLMLPWPSAPQEPAEASVLPHCEYLTRLSPAALPFLRNSGLAGLAALPRSHPSSAMSTTKPEASNWSCVKPLDASQAR